MIYTLKATDTEYIKQLAEIEKTCFSEPWSEKSLTDEIKKNTSTLLVYLENNTVLGYVGLQTVLDEGYITNIAVLPHYRRIGIAKALINELIFISENKELSFISLEVRESNTNAINLYNLYDFRNVGLRKNFYSFPTENAIIMTKYFK